MFLMDSNYFQVLKSNNHVNNIFNYVNEQVKIMILTFFIYYQILEIDKYLKKRFSKS